MRKKLWNKQIPTLLGLILLAFSVGVVSWFGRQYTEVRSRASGGDIPRNVQISNITNTSFTVSYITDIKTTAVIFYGRDSNLGQVAFDNRDRDTGKPGLYQVHFVTVENLESGLKYYFSIQSGATTFLENTRPYEATTAKIQEIFPSDQRSVEGSVNLPDGSIPLEGIVSISSGNSQVLSALLKADGSYSIALKGMMTQDLTSYIDFSKQTILNMIIQNSTSQSIVTLLANKINQVPLITLSKDYDFTAGYSSELIFHSASDSGTASVSAELTPDASSSAVPASSAASVSSASAFPSFDTQVAAGLDILTPKADEKFIDQQPLFQGTALPNATVAIAIGLKEPIQTTVQADGLGNWQYRPADPIAPGQHVITVVMNDLLGKPQTLSHNFTVFALGSQFTEPSVSPLISPVSTVSAIPTVNVVTLVPTNTPTLTPTVTPNLTLTMAASLSLTPDPAALTATALSKVPNPNSLTLTAAAQDSGNNLPPSGNYSLLAAGVIVGISIIGGLVLFFF